MAQNIPNSIAQTLQQQIVSGHFPVGSFLPGQRELAESLGVSRASLREALSVLETLGLVDILPGKGVKVLGAGARAERLHRAFATPSLGTLSPRQLIELRLVIEPGWAALAAERATAATKRQLQWLQAQMTEALARNDLIAGAEADLNFHLLLAQMSGNPGLMAMAQQLETAIAHSLRLPFASTGSDDEPAREHQTILDAVFAGDSVACASAMRAHLLSAARRSGMDPASPDRHYGTVEVPTFFRLIPSQEGDL